MRRFTRATVDAIKPDPPRRQEVPDPATEGLYLVVQPSGSKSWAVRYRLNGRSRKFTIGGYPGIGLGEARRQAEQAMERVREGIDPAAEAMRKRVQTARPRGARSDTVSALVAEYMTRKAKDFRSVDEVRRTFERDILPVIGDRPVASVTKRELIELLDDIADRPAPTLAVRNWENLRALFNWAVARDWLPASPMAGVVAPAALKARDRVLTPHEIRLFWIATEEMADQFGDALRVCLLTGQRVGEVLGMTRHEITGDTWTIPGERAKNGEPHEVPLAPEVANILRAAPVINGSALVFTTTGRAPVSGRSKAKARLDALMSGAGDGVEVPRFTIHDLRRTAASGMAELGVSPHIIEAVLNHRTGVIRGIARVYNRHPYQTEKREALEAWADRVAAIVREADDAKVVALRAQS